MRSFTRPSGEYALQIRLTPRRGGAVQLVAAIMTVAIMAVVAPLARAAAPSPTVPRLALDLSRHQVDITTGFTGADLLMFGNLPEAGDLVVVIRGPDRPESMRRKARKLGIWVNTGRATILGAPAYYHIAATAQPAKILPQATRVSEQIGVDTLKMAIKDGDKGATPTQYRDALIRLKQRAGLYGRTILPITIVEHRLFRTSIHFPADVPTGSYHVTAYLIDQGKIVASRTTPLTITKVGLGESIYAFAQKQAAIYGIVAIALAALAGWLAAIAFRKK
jgi:uncharacterized protein (TIGR02186 family)